MGEQFAALMQQQAQLTTTVQQLVQLQHAQQAAAGTPSYPEQAGLRSAKIFDFEALEVHDFRWPKYDDWAFNFKRAIRSSNCDAYTMLVHVERATDEFQEDVVDPQFEGLRMESVSAELNDLLCQACTGYALSCTRHVLWKICADSLLGNDYTRSTTPGPWREPFALSRQSRTRRRSKS